MSAAAITRDGSAEPVMLRLQEWEGRTFEGVALSPEGRAFAERLARDGEARLEILELRDGLRVRARSWVGTIRLDHLEIRIEPKLARDRVDLVRLLELVSGLDGLVRLAGDAGLDIAGKDLFDLVCLLFAEATQRLLRRGLLADYLEREEFLPMVRGRILPERQVLERFGQLDRIACRYDELEHDIPENKLLAAALEVAQRRVRSEEVRRRLARLGAEIAPLCSSGTLDLRRARAEIVYNRLNEHYREAHQLAWMVLDGLGVDDLLSPGSTRCFAFLLDMSLLFERFVSLLVRRAVGADYRVRDQASQHSVIWDASAQRHYSRVVPDLLLETKEASVARLAIDAKYKLYDERKVSPGDIYQTFLYAYSLGQRAGGGGPGALVVYPASQDTPGSIHLRIRPLYEREGASIHGLGIPVPQALEELESASAGHVVESIRTIIGKITGTSGDES